MNIPSPTLALGTNNVNVMNQPFVRQADIPWIVGYQVVGSEGNLWLAYTTAIGEASAAVDKLFHPVISVFGNSSAAVTLTIQHSADNATWYSTSNTIAVLAGADFGSNFSNIAARYVRLSASAVTTITATLQATG